MSALWMAKYNSGVVCHVDTLDGYIAEHRLPPPEFIKIDVERSEIDCLRGARETLRTRPPLVIEFPARSVLAEGLALLTATAGSPRKIKRA